MRINLPNRQARTESSVLIVTLVVALLLGLVLTSYLLLVRAQHVSVMRSQAWHAALTAAEAGVEEALAALNPAPLVTNQTAGWFSTNALSGAAYSVSYTPAVPPVIYATGYATIPALSATIRRVVEVRTMVAPLFSVGAAVRGAITLNGRKLVADSFNSANWPHRYDATNAGNQGDIGSVDGVVDFAEVDIRGRWFLGATATNVGGWKCSAAGGMFKDLSMEFPNVLPPSFSGTVYTPRPGTNSGVAYTYLLGAFGNLNYRTTNLYGSIFVATNANAVLHVTGNADITSLVVPPGASLTLYVGGPNATLGQTTVLGKPRDFQYFGLPGNTNITLAGYDSFTGAVYAPNATLHAGEKLSGEPFIDTDLYGAVAVKAINMRSDLLLHFDESLRQTPTSGSVRGFVVASWQELPPP